MSSVLNYADIYIYSYVHNNEMYIILTKMSSVYTKLISIDCYVLCRIYVLCVLYSFWIKTFNFNASRISIKGKNIQPSI